MQSIARALLAMSGLVGLVNPSIAEAQQAAVMYPRVIESGENKDIDYGPGPRGNVFGGGFARIVGSGESSEIVYDGPLAAQEPMFRHVISGGDNLQVLYSRFADRQRALAEAGIVIPGRPARPQPAEPASAATARAARGG